MKKIWKIIKEYPTYKVSNYGEILSLPRKVKFGWAYRYTDKKLLKGSIAGGGYLKVSLGRRAEFYVHRIVGEYFVKGYKKGCEVNHKDGNKLNNRSDNLEWISRSKNMRHAINTGLIDVSGENNPHAKLNCLDVKEIKKLLLQGRSHDFIASKFNVSRPTISYINSGKTWREVA
jgi:hypothetical protein